MYLAIALPARDRAAVIGQGHRLGGGQAVERRLAELAAIRLCDSRIPSARSTRRSSTSARMKAYGLPPAGKSCSIFCHSRSSPPLRHG